MAFEGACVVHGMEKLIRRKYDLRARAQATPAPLFMHIKGLLAEPFGIGLIKGASGSGKSSLLRDVALKLHFKLAKEKLAWRKAPLCEHFANASDAECKLLAVGLNSIITWVQPYATLSSGEKARADMARQLASRTMFDEFTSNIDRVSAASLSCALRKYVARTATTGIILAGVHDDLLPFLMPSWVFDADELSITRPNHEFILPRPVFTAPGGGQADTRVSIHPCDSALWAGYRQYHYLSADICANCKTWLVSVNIRNISSGFKPAGIIAVMPSLPINNTPVVREHRLVLRPAFQGMGLGVMVSNALAAWHKTRKTLYYTSTSHPALAGYRNGHPELWRTLASSGKPVTTNYQGKGVKPTHRRVIHRHQYVGSAR